MAEVVVMVEAVSHLLQSTPPPLIFFFPPFRHNKVMTKTHSEENINGASESVLRTEVRNMNESKSRTKQRKGGADEPRKVEMKKLTVRVGYDNAQRPVKFTGVYLCGSSNQSYQGPNQNRYHEWSLYKVLSKRDERMFRVLDAYFTHWQGETGINTLSDPLTGEEVAKEFPTLCSEMISEGIVKAWEIAEDLDEEG